MRKRWATRCGGWLLALAAVATVAMPSDTPPAEAQSGEVAEAIDHAAAEYGVSRACLRFLAWRESRFTPWVDNLQGSGAQGLFQFMPGTWRWMSAQAGYGGASPYDPWSAAHVAAWAISHPAESQGGLRHWGGRC